MEKEEYTPLSLEDISDIEDGGNPDCIISGGSDGSIDLEIINSTPPSVMNLIPGVLYYAFTVFENYLIHSSSITETEAVNTVLEKAEEISGISFSAEDISVVEFLPKENGE